ncbi:MAG: aminoglycoside 3'-phosphotransferase [Roseburia sp.]|nr:aminoglycoside 3'-phosphotransferase [Roseburia sp.]
MVFPAQIGKIVSGEPYQVDSIGMSGSKVLIFSDKVLKVQDYNRDSENEYRMLTWLQGKLPVPEVIACGVMDKRLYLLMSKCSGEMACERKYMEQPEKLAGLLAEGLKRLWEVDISDCPVDARLQNKLARAAYYVEKGLVDMDYVEPETFGENGFKGPEELLQWLRDNRPKEEPVLSHGDFCLPNVFLSDGRVTGYLDLGGAGVADKWCDIALCYRSLSHNYSGKYGRQAYSGFDGQLLFRELGIEPDWEKIRYYILLDELF